jgi:membrane-bound lytic murein transglycosylase D
MDRWKLRALVVCLASLLSGCASAPAQPPAPPPPAPLPPSNPAPSIHEILKPAEPALVAPLDAVSLAIGKADAAFDAGRAEFDRGRLEAAREHFDRAVDLLLEQPGGAKADRRLQIAFERMVERITAIEIQALREADGVTEARSEPAAIDEVLSAALFERPAPKATTAETVAADLAESPRDIPIELNAKVLQYVELYQGRLRQFLQDGLDRGQQYLPMIRAAFQAEGVPLDLAYIPLVESAFKSTATSRASARGMWQFMLPTAKEHGLVQDWFLDERADPEKATRAAAKYLKTLHGMFDGDWEFALASYNGGPGRLQRAVRQSKSTDFWKIAESSRYLPRETREYVPMILAAIIVAKHPDLYGFDVASAAPLAYETVEVPGAVDLKLIAEWADVELEDLQALNPELRRTTTPMTAHRLKVPVGTGAPIQARLETAPDTLYRAFRFHTVKRGDTLSSIARRYGVPVQAVRDANNLTARSRLSVRQTLAIPLPSTPALPSASRPSAQAAGAGSRTYRVRAGDTLFSIARQFSTSVTTLKQLNGLTSDRIRVGDQIRISR